MKKIFTLFMLLFILSLQNLIAEEPAGWMPKWNVGDWWVVTVNYDASLYNPIAASIHKRPVKVDVKYTIVSEEILNGEKVFKIEIRPERIARYGPGNRDIFVLKKTLEVRKVIYYEEHTNQITEFLIDKGSSISVIDKFGYAKLIVIPIFPLVSNKAERKNDISFKRSDRPVGKQDLVGITQYSYIAGKTEIPWFENIKSEYLQGRIYKVTFEVRHPLVEYWCESAPWFVYSYWGDIKCYLKEYHSQK